MSETSEFEVNGRRYRRPVEPSVVVCLDGSEPGYIEAAVAAGRAPFFERAMREGTSLIARCVVPSFTNPNNLSIVTGRPPSTHGISGNFFLDPRSGEEVMMNDPRLLRAPTVFQAAQSLGLRVAVITAKDKLRRLLGSGLRFGRGDAVCFSSERADRVTLADNGIEGVTRLVGLPVPDVYSAALSEFVLAAGVALMQRDRPDLTYLSTTDYVQHKHPPGSPPADDFYAMLDRYLQRLDECGCAIAITADHGMNAKHDPATLEPNVIYLQSRLDGWLGSGACRVILPITDPYVVHHGALGSYATVYLAGGPTEALSARLAACEGIEAVLSRAEACRRFELPADRVGDLVVIATRDHVLGTSPERHDLSALSEPLRSHGGLSEEAVPLILNRAVSRHTLGCPRNFDAFALILNRAA